ncbi:MAG: prephenate dehydrogenase [Candidatus Aenigmatarchaeota archaeon]
MLKVGIVGGGSMGQWLKKEISKKHKVLIYDSDKRKSDTSSLNELSKFSDVLIVAVPFWITAKVLHQIIPYAENKLVMDISTFKEGLIDVYKKYPKKSKIATIHPMFGPGAKTIKKQKILVMKIPNRDGLDDAIKFWKNLGARVYIVDLKKHDYYISYTIALSYAIGLALARIYEDLGKDVFKYGGTSFRWLVTYSSSLLLDKNSRFYAEKAPLDKFIRALKKKSIPKPLINPKIAYQKFYKVLSNLDYRDV